MAEIISKDRKAYRIWDKINGVWNELRFLTNAKSVDADDGENLEVKIGAINGITSDLSGEADDIAASIACVKQLNDSLGDISNVGNDTYNSVEKLLQYYIDNGYLPHVDLLPLIPPMSSNTTPSGVASASTVSGDNQAYRAFDTIVGNQTDVWWSTKSTNQWLQYQFTDKVIVRKLQLATVNLSGYRLNNFTLQGSNDGDIFTPIYSGKMQPNDGVQTFTFGNNTPYQYYRLNCVDVYDGQAIVVAEMQLFGSKTIV